MEREQIEIGMDMALALAIADYADGKNITLAEARDKLVPSKAVDMLYDFDIKLWWEGPLEVERLFEEIG